MIRAILFEQKIYYCCVHNIIVSIYTQYFAQLSFFYLSTSPIGPFLKVRVGTQENINSICYVRCKVKIDEIRELASNQVHASNDFCHYLSHTIRKRDNQFVMCSLKSICRSYVRLQIATIYEDIYIRSSMNFRTPALASRLRLLKTLEISTRETLRLYKLVLRELQNYYPISLTRHRSVCWHCLTIVVAPSLRAENDYILLHRCTQHWQYPERSVLAHKI